uniref:Sialyltransferase-like protein n=1 Tax=Tetraselmis sp. GSL018 TaxID=582737 RepID=A0A061RQ57_9CHLO
MLSTVISVRGKIYVFFLACALSTTGWSVSVSGSVSRYDEYYEDDDPESSAPAKTSLRKRSISLQHPSGKCSCSAGKASCSSPEAWQSASVSNVCPISEEAVRLRKDRHCKIVAMGFESKTTPSKICKPSTPAPSNSTQSQSASQKHKAMIENIRDMELASAIVAIRAVAPLLGLWKGPSREPFYTKANAGALRGKGDPDPFDGDALKRLPAEQPRLAARSCAVVGNSGTLLSEMSAPDVDRHDFVLRINQGPTLPNYVAHTGEKTSARLVNRKFTQLYSLRPWLQSDPMGVAVIASRSSVRDFVALADSVMANHSGKAALFANSELVRDASAALVAFRTGFKLGLDIGMGGSGFIAPSTGFLAVQLASQICSNITVFGFSLAPPTCKSAGCRVAPFHYFAARRHGLLDRPGPVSAKPDKFILEGWFLKALHILGLVCIEPQPSFLGPCGSRLDGLVDRFGKPTRAWPSLEEIINDDALSRVLSQGPPRQRTRIRLHESTGGWVSTPLRASPYLRTSR